jgi:hypothetical protein
MRHDDTRDDIWSLSSSQLATRCSSIAESDSPAADEALRAEAERLHAEWQDALHLPHEDFDEQARRSALLLALRKRTIEILVRIGQRQ